MLVLKLKEYLTESGKQEPLKFLVKSLGIKKGKAYKLLNGKQQSINHADLSKLCLELQCTPNDLYYWQPSPSMPIRPNHPILLQLTPPLAISTWNEALKHFTAAEAQQLNTRCKY